MNKLRPINFVEGTLILLDQRLLPHEEVYLENKNLDDVYLSIKEMVVRGAPCIGFTGIFGIALWLKNNTFDIKEFRKACDYLISSRPTAINLAFEIERCFQLVNDLQDKNKAYMCLVDFAFEQMNLSEKNHRKMAKLAQSDLEKKLGKKAYKILTHCNTGYLACASLGTALGVIDHLADQNLIDKVWVDETRPYMQGVRLTAFELNKLNIKHEVVVEGAASYLMSHHLVDAIFVGADRIASNGDTANKIGTSNLAIIAKNYKIPFYVMAPKSSFDMTLKTGQEIEIELRNEEEILSYGEHRIAPVGTHAFNPSFDITSSEFITGIICEDGLIEGDFEKNLKRVFNDV